MGAELSQDIVSLARTIWDNFHIQLLLKAQHVIENHLIPVLSIEGVRADSSEMIDDDLRLIYCEQLAPQKLDEWLGKELLPFTNVVLFKDVMATNIDLIPILGDLWQVLAVALSFALHGREQEQSHHREILVREELRWQTDHLHEVPHIFPQSVSLAVLPTLEQIPFTHELT